MRIQVAYRDPVPVHRLALFLESRLARASEDRWYGEESRERVGQASPPYQSASHARFRRDVKGLGLLGDRRANHDLAQAEICADRPGSSDQ